MTIICHVDYLKISFKDGWEITKIIKQLGRIYGDIKVKKEKKHHYHGMDLDFGNKEMVKVSMIPYMEEIIKSFPEEVGTSVANTLAAKY